MSPPSNPAAATTAAKKKTAADVAVKAARDARLTALETAVTAWATKEEARITAEKTFLTSILKGRTGAGRLTAQNTADASKRLVDEIDQFLSR